MTLLDRWLIKDNGGAIFGRQCGFSIDRINTDVFHILIKQNQKKKKNIKRKK